MSLTLAERLAEDRRRVVLNVLASTEGFALNEDLVTRELARLRLGTITRDDTRSLLAWLERQGLVTVEKLPADAVVDGELWLAKASRLGRDVSRGATWPGIAAPL